jgi:hypothetical protein
MKNRIAIAFKAKGAVEGAYCRVLGRQEDVIADGVVAMSWGRPS